MHFLTKRILDLSNDNYKAFSQKLIPDTNYDIIGVKIPILKTIAKNAYINTPYEVGSFLKEKHTYLEEWLLHGLILSQTKDIDTLIYSLNDFLPFVDNWAVCDCSVMAMKIIKKHPEKSLTFIKGCLKSCQPYIVRFGIVALLAYFLDANFTKEIIELALSVKSENYYVNMGLAWLYSVALIKQYDSVIYIFKNKLLPKFTHNKSIQKAIESFRIPNQIKSYLKTLKIK